MQHPDPSLAPVKTATLFPLHRVILDLAITGAFWVFISYILRAHVPSEDPFWITLWSCVTGLCISGVFFIALQMFRSVLHKTPEV